MAFSPPSSPRTASTSLSYQLLRGGSTGTGEDSMTPRERETSEYFHWKEDNKTYLEEAAKETDPKPVFSERCCYVVAGTTECHH